MASQTPAKFGGPRHLSSGDIFKLLCDIVRPRDQRAE